MAQSVAGIRNSRCPRLFGLNVCRGSASLIIQPHASINRKGACVPKIPTIAFAGLWSAITVAALTVVALGQSQPLGGARVSHAASASAAVPATTALTPLTDATGKRYRTRRE